MTNTNIAAILNTQSKSSQVIKKAKNQKIDIDNLVPNQFNQFPMIEIEELKSSILETGLMNPLIVYENDQGKYTIVSGHRRYAALKQLTETIEDFDKEIRCVVISTPSNSLTERELVYLGNKGRTELSEKQLLVIVKDLMEMWEEKPAEEKTGKERRDYVAKMINMSARTAQKYISKINSEIKPVDPTKDAKKEAEKAEKEAKKSIKKASKEISASLSKINESSVKDSYVNLYTLTKLFQNSLDITKRGHGISLTVKDTLSLLELIAHEVEEAVNSDEIANNKGKG